MSDTQPRPEEKEMRDYIDVVFDGPPDHKSGRFVEVESPEDRGIKAGEWIDRGNGLWALRIRPAAFGLKEVPTHENEMWEARQRHEPGTYDDGVVWFVEWLTANGVWSPLLRSDCNTEAEAAAWRMANDLYQEMPENMRIAKYVRVEP